MPVLVSGIPTCYVATTNDGDLCYVQWLIISTGQELIRPFFKGQLKFFPADTVLLEFAYTFERFRGLGIMSAAMAQIAERGIELGARSAITYVAHRNIASLKGCARAGFLPFMLRYEKWRAFRLSQKFTNLPDGFSYPFESRDQSGKGHLSHAPV
ncbi:MAG: hypothetical protein IVW54_16355 [Candidatus Binataceae bacterium]|nr:hypothetical protein [Candidatus Binataceae bacterium]